MSIGDRVKECRIRLGYSAEQVAEKLGISPATEYRYENGDISKMPAKLIAPLADFLSTTPAYLMGWTDDCVPDLSTVLAKEEKDLVDSYRSLSPKGQQLLIDRSEELKVLYGKKPEDSLSEPG